VREKTLCGRACVDMSRDSLLNREREESDITRRLFDKKRRECTAVSVQNKVGKMLVQYVETRQIYPFNIIIHLT